MNMQFYHIDAFTTKLPASPVFIALLIFTLIFTGCSTVDLSLMDSERNLLAESNINPELIDEALQNMGQSKIDSMIISVGDEIILERYNNTYQRDDRHDLRSATKSITSLLVGIAIDKGFIESVDQPILQYFPEYSSLNSHFPTITIAHLLTMTSGLDSDDWIPASPGNEERMYRRKSWVEFFFKLEPKFEAGKVFQYSTAGVIVLGEIISRASGRDYRDFAREYLFEPLGIINFQFKITPAGESDSGGHLQLRPLDFHKIAEVYLAGGAYNEQQIVSEFWIQESLLPRIQIDRGDGNPYVYEGYLWWLDPVINGKVKSYQARGNGGQYLFVFPELDLICSFTGSAYNSDKQALPFYLVQNYILPAVRGRF